MRLVSVILIVCIVVGMLSCSKTTEPNTKVVKDPVLDPLSGTYEMGRIITITCPTSNAQIRFTTDGSEPDSASALNTEPLIIPFIFPVNTFTGTVKAKAFKEKYESSQTISASYSITNISTVATPVIVPMDESILSGARVSLTCSTPQSQIRYTTNGDEPTSNSALYQNPFVLVPGGQLSIKAKAFKDYWYPSSTASGSYTYTAPYIMIPHLGDTGDLPVTYNGETIMPDDENNGIDTVPEGNWIRISWQHITDNAIQMLKVYRYDEFNPTPVLRDSIASTQDFYVDNAAQLLVNVTYSYFIQSLSNAGEFRVSDVVSYKLLAKPILSTPANAATLSNQNLEFTWQSNGFASKYRFLMFDENHDYVWHRDIDVAFEEDSFSTTFPANLATDYAGQSMYWRVDAFDWDSELGMFIGSESEERVVYFSRR